MLDFGDELALESFRIPWLIWIQLLVLLLLLALLYCFSIVALDPSPSASTTPSDSRLQQLSNHHSTVVTNRLQSNRDLKDSIFRCNSISAGDIILQSKLKFQLGNLYGVENPSIKGEIATTGSTGIMREEISEREASTSSLYFLHPCYYFNLAREAFLKCLGLDSTSESDGHDMKTKHRKRKES